MTVGVLLLHLFTSLGIISYTIYQMRKGVTLLNSFLFIFVSCCCLGVNLLEVFPEALPQTQYSDIAITRVALANLIFMGLAFVALLVEGVLLKTKQTERKGVRVIPTSTDVRFVVITASVLITAFLALWLGRMSEVSDPFGAYKETSESGQYYKYRQFIEEDIIAKAGQGTWSAKKLALNVGPFTMVFLGYFLYRTRNWLYFVLLMVQSAVGILVTGILAHKSYLLISVFSPFFALLIWQIHRFKLKWVISALALLFVIGGTIIFKAALNSNIQDAFSEFLVRVFLVPAFVPVYYYEVIPDGLPFRGMLESLYIYHTRAPAGDYAVHDVAYYATGRAYGSNANFLAVAYSGTGFLGVFWVAALCLALTVLMDYYLSELDRDHRVVAIFFSVAGFIGITSINFLGAIENGFLIGSLVFFLLCRGRKSAQTVRSSENVSLVNPLPSNAA